MEVWPFAPQVGVTESLEWLTDYTRTKGSVDRLALRLSPRTTFDYTYKFSPTSYSKAKQIARHNGHEKLLVPVWVDAHPLPYVSTTDTGYEFDVGTRRFGTQAIIWESEQRWEVVDVLWKSQDIVEISSPNEEYERALFMPLLPSLFSQDLTVSRGQADTVGAVASFVSTEDYGTYEIPDGVPQHRDSDLLDHRPHIVGDMKEVASRPADRIESPMGIISSLNSYLTPDQTFTIGWSTNGRQKHWELRSWFYRRRGRLSGFWMPSWNRDFTPASKINYNSYTLSFYGYVHPSEPPFDLYILLKSGAYHIISVVSSSEGPGGRVYVNLDNWPGFTAEVAEISMISKLQYVALSSDRVEFTHQPGGSVTTSVGVEETPANYSMEEPT